MTPGTLSVTSIDASSMIHKGILNKSKIRYDVRVLTTLFEFKDPWPMAFKFFTMEMMKLAQKFGFYCLFFFKYNFQVDFPLLCLG